MALLGFLALLVLTALGLIPARWLGLVLGLDPLIVVVIGLGARARVGGLVLSAVVLVVAALAGRRFCSWLCPLGTTLDLANRLLGGWAGRFALPPETRRRLRHLPVAVLALVLGAALAGLDLLGVLAPLVLTSRAVVSGGLPPVVHLAEMAWPSTGPAVGAHWGAEAGPPWATVPPLSAALAALLVLAVPLGSSVVGRRAWCRWICPLGTLLGLLERLVPRRRAAEAAPVARDRRALVAGAAAAFAAGAVGGLVPGGSAAARVPVRPPGSLPEPDFLLRCVRCGACTAACPTDALQPDWLTDAAALWAPSARLRRGPCDQGCVACGEACPTGAITRLDLEERRYARLGIATVSRDRCYPWQEDRRCLVCEAVCPYGAIRLEQRVGTPFGLPVVDPERCNGCGYCQHLCPCPDHAIEVEPWGALRLVAGSYRDAARSEGLVLEERVRERLDVDDYLRLTRPSEAWPSDGEGE